MKKTNNYISIFGYVKNLNLIKNRLKIDLIDDLDVTIKSINYIVEEKNKSIFYSLSKFNNTYNYTSNFSCENSKKFRDSIINKDQNILIELPEFNKYKVGNIYYLRCSFNDYVRIKIQKISFNYLFTSDISSVDNLKLYIRVWFNKMDYDKILNKNDISHLDIKNHNKNYYDDEYHHYEFDHFNYSADLTIIEKDPNKNCPIVKIKNKLTYNDGYMIYEDLKNLKQKVYQEFFENNGTKL